MESDLYLILCMKVDVGQYLDGISLCNAGSKRNEQLMSRSSQYVNIHCWSPFSGSHACLLTDTGVVHSEVYCLLTMTMSKGGVFERCCYTLKKYGL